MKKIIKLCGLICVAAILGLGSFATPVKAAAKNEFVMTTKSKPLDPTIKKSPNYNSDTKDYFVMKSYLDAIEEAGGGKITVKKGTYNFCYTLYVPSNTTIEFEKGVVINKTDKVGKAKTPANNKLFVFAPFSQKDKKNVYKKYNGVHDVSLVAKGKTTINLNMKDSLVFVLAHNNNVNISGLTVNMKAKGAKGVNIVGCSNVKIDSCSFSSSKKDGKAVLIDVASSKGIQSYTWAKMDNTVCKNITVNKCKFSKLENAVYSNRFMKSKYQKNVKVTKCTFNTLTDDAIKMQNWDSPVIKDCKFEKIGQGAVAKDKDIKLGINMCGVKNPTVSGNYFNNVERSIYVSRRENNDSKLKSQGYTINSITEECLKKMAENNKVGLMGDYYIARLDKPGEINATKYWFKDSLAEYVITPTTTPYRNQFVRMSDYSANKTYYMFRSYMEQIERNGGGTIEIKAGTYSLTNRLRIPSNITIKLDEGVVIKGNFPGKDQGPMFELCNQTDLENGVKYTKHNGVHDVEIIGPANKNAVLDRCYIFGNVITMAHTNNVHISNITFKNLDQSDAHYIEIDASSNVTVENCIFNGGKYVNGENTKEAINIDVPDINTGGFHADYTSYDCTPNENIYIKGNTFTKLPVAVGTHMYTDGAMHKNIQILNNTIKTIDYYGIRCMNWDSPIIKGNNISGIKAKAPAQGQAIYFQGVKKPTVTGNTISNVVWFMRAKPMRYTESNVNKKNEYYKKLLKYSPVLNSFTKDDYVSLGFYNNTFGSGVENKGIWFRNGWDESEHYDIITYLDSMDDASSFSEDDMMLVEPAMIDDVNDDTTDTEKDDVFDEAELVEENDEEISEEVIEEISEEVDEPSEEIIMEENIQELAEEL